MRANVQWFGSAGGKADMAYQSSPNITQLLLAWSNGDQAALDQLMPIVYQELHRLARQHMRREQPGQSCGSGTKLKPSYIWS
jgi:RNA polymerase sigma-70 factor (ECF subfamily)